MADGSKFFSALLLISGVYVLGIVLFSRGFLLKRYAISDKSNCSDVEDLWGKRSGESRTDQSCRASGKYSKAVLIIIDALRFDFARYEKDILENETLPYQNKLPVIHEVLTQKPQHGRLFKFVADPPTTTMQRLKGLTTGSLPTFVDAGNNFASSEIDEDNIISQLVGQGKKVTFMGDDTWVTLFPNSFYKSFPFPSFDVKDLHTVDNGVTTHLVPELSQSDADVLIAHFLGVDHCGHRYGPYHPAMADKLGQMDHMLRSVIDILDSDTVLLVLGDHGMTRTGDHGGDSDDEVSAALFAFSPKPLADVSYQESDVVSQIDLVPTIASLLGFPIPFGNLGTVITGLLPKEPLHGKETGREDNLILLRQQLADARVRISALYANALQVNSYLTEYSQISAEMPREDLRDLSLKFKELNQSLSALRPTLNAQSNSLVNGNLNHEDLAVLLQKMKSLEESYKDYLSRVKRLCQSLWATFDMRFIACGMFVLFTNLLSGLTLIYHAPVVYSLPLSVVKLSAAVFVVGTLAAAVLTAGSPYPLLGLFIVAESSNIGFLGVVFINSLRDKDSLSVKAAIMKTSNPQSFFALVLCVLHVLSQFSNSFVVNEDKIVSFFVQSLVTAFVSLQIWGRLKGKAKPVRNTSKKAKEDANMSNQAASLTWVLFCTLLFQVCGRIALLFKSCREEQPDCEPSSFLQPLSALVDPGLTANHRFLLTVFSVCVLPFGLRYWLRHWGNLNGSSLVVLCVKYALPAAALSICVHWALQIVPHTLVADVPLISLWQQVILPQLAYFSCLVTIGCLLLSPVCAYIVFRDRKHAVENRSASTNPDMQMVHMLVQEVKAAWDKKETNPAPLVYGLATVYSSAVLVLTVTVVLPLMMLLGDGVAVTVLLLVIQKSAFLEIVRCLDNSTPRTDRFQGPCWSEVVLWGLLSSHYFYCTGHQATIPAIRFEAAFVGLPGNLANFVLPGALVFLNTFAAQVICVVTLPLLFFWPMIPSGLMTSDVSTGPRVVEKGEYELHQQPTRLRESMFRLAVMYQLFHALRLFATAGSAALHRRHLMVWKIFAPRFIFEAASFGLTTFVLLCVFVVVMRIDSALRVWTEKLQQQCETLEL